MSEIVSTNYYGPALNPNEVPWYLHEAEDDGVDAKLARAVMDTVQDIERRQFSIFDGNRRHAKIYAGYLPNGLAWGSAPISNQRVPFEATKNVARAVCDTATSLIVKNRPKPTFVTDGADFEVQQQAEDMDSFMVGAYMRGGLYEVAPRSFLDSTVFGTGGWKYVPRGKGEDFHVAVERILPDDIVVDEDECREHLEPQNVYHRVFVRVDALIRKYAPGNSAKDRDIRMRLMAAQQTQSWPTRHVPKGRCVLVEAIHVDPENSSLNRRWVGTMGITLVDEEWPHDFHPYTFLWWSQPLSGFYGDGVCYRQYGRQQRITYMYRWIQKVHDIYGTPRAWVDPAGGPPTLQLSNEIGAVIMARKKPEFQVQNSVPPEMYKWLDGLERGTFEDEGMNQATGTGALPVGVESAPAQREWSFKEGQKFATVSQRWEHAVAVEPAYKMVAMFRRAVARGAKPKMTWADRKRLYTVKWPDLKADAYVIRPEASSLDSLSPAARTQSALELAQTGWIRPEEGRALVAHPDLKESDDLGNAGETYAKFVLRKLRHGEAVAVDDKADLVSLDRVIRQGRLLAITQDAPQGIVDNMARYLDELDAAKQNAVATMAVPPSAPAPGLAMTPGAPTALPGGPMGG